MPSSSNLYALGLFCLIVALKDVSTHSIKFNGDNPEHRNVEDILCSIKYANLKTH